MLRMVRSAIKRHGGKGYLAKKIVKLLPPHRVYAEPFAGGLSVLLSKDRSEVEVAGDLDANLMHFWTTLRDRSQEVIDRVRGIPYTRDIFKAAGESLEDDDPIVRAVAFMVRNRMSRGGFGKDFAWSKRLRGGRPGDENGWLTIQVKLREIADRLHHVELYHADALELIERYEGPDTLFYCDPPYLASTRTARKAYVHEMTDRDHQRLLRAITGLQGMVVLSGYRSDLYDAALAGWERVEFEMPNNAGQTKEKSRRVEVVWLNEAAGRFELRG